ncbi:MAG: hypothetical protein KC912_08960 [Proteobacteria bacterium]|nr:hypothetical protein [Pseudomonadota bacterium]
MQAALTLLATRTGTYAGAGVNHDGQPFRGVLRMHPVLGGRGTRLRFVATATDGTLLHEEETLIGAEPSGSPTLVTLSSNLPGLLVHHLVDVARGEAVQLVFRHGDVDDDSVFREEIRIGMHPEGDVTYAFAWGMPGQPFADRSGVRMRRIGD